MTGNNFKEKKVVPLIFTQFWSRSHLNKLDRLTPQDVYYGMYTYGIYTYGMYTYGMYTYGMYT